MNDSNMNDFDFDVAQGNDTNFRPRSQKALIAAGLVLSVLLILSFVIPSILLDKRETELRENLMERQAVLADSRATLFRQWLNSIERQTDRVVENELFRLFAYEVDLVGGDLTLVAPGADDSDLSVSLFDQLPFMERVLTDFTANSDFLASYLYGRSGVAYLVSGGAPSLGLEQAQLAEAAIKSGRSLFGPVRQEQSGLVMDLVVPILPAQSEENLDAPVAAMLLTFPVTTQIAEFLAPHPLDQEGESFRLVQQNGDMFQELAPQKLPNIQTLNQEVISLRGDQVFGFGLRTSLTSDQQVYQTGAYILDDLMWVVLEKDKDLAEQELNNFNTVVVALAVLIILIVSALFVAFWWRLSSEHHAQMHNQFKALAQKINQQKQFLDKINGSIADYIGLKGSDGSYRYVNRAFSQGVGRPEEQIIGMDDAALFGSGTAARMAVSDQRALTSQSAITSSERVFLNNKEHHLQISKVPFLGNNNEVSGLVSVFRDVTDLVEEQRKREKAVQQTVTALVRAVELRDPYLGGHSRRVSQFAVMVANQMQLDHRQVTTVEIAANLSQIGKLAIPRDILNKPERLSPEEIAQVQRHPEHAERLLRDIDFDLPVLDTILQMHERLDGKGYPKGLQNDNILLTARILGACDVFCARIEPRSYRSGMPTEEALEILESNLSRYDSNVVKSLREIAYSVDGEKLIATIQANPF
ncbi:HD-GYP domain-containing protein [Kiloniella sp. b19]|uniref:HD-GYP domain-containing protein n=1 Tax=Kiloniella sp. GXU_MW_B19 TaxID=3141326 RepID=UPI0031CF27C1